jgi:hypothetical protein
MELMDGCGRQPKRREFNIMAAEVASLDSEVCHLIAAQKKPFLRHDSVAKARLDS